MKQDHVWAFEHCSCVYESDFRVESLHFRAVSTCKAMKAFRDQKIQSESWGAMPFLGFSLYPHEPRDRGGKPGWSVRIRKLEVAND